MNKKKLVFATNNPHKLQEARRIISDDFEIVSLEQIGCHDDIPETAETLEGNALIKARWIKEKYGYDCFADDTGLMVDALDGRPGVYSARYAGPHCSPDDNIVKILSELQGVTDRKARFETVIALSLGDKEYTFSGRVDGRIATERHGADGFGYDPVFIPDELPAPDGSLMPNTDAVSFAEMSQADKNAISHRGRATAALIGFLLK